MSTETKTAAALTAGDVVTSYATLTGVRETRATVESIKTDEDAVLVRWAEGGKTWHGAADSFVVEVA